MEKNLDLVLGIIGILCGIVGAATKNVVVVGAGVVAVALALIL